jgi:YfiH family protein
VAELADGSGVVAVSLGDALALFADARSSPGRPGAEELAGMAGAAIRRLTGREVPVLYARQEHTSVAFTFSSTERLAAGAHAVGTCDALLTAEPWTALVVRTADCLPVALVGGGVVAMVHAGWRGLAADVLAVAVRRMGAEFGVPVRDVRAVIGVGIGPCHYTVGEEVVAALSRREVVGDAWRGGGAVDLSRWAFGRLLALGVPGEEVRVLPGCTACSPTRHSHRRDGAVAGRQWSAVLLAGGLEPPRG